MKVSPTSLTGAVFYSTAAETERNSAVSDAQALRRNAAVKAQDETGDTVSISSAAAQRSQNDSTYSPYFPVRPGMSADALIDGVSKPGSVSSSQGKSFPDVAADARKRMDEKYAAMNTGGKPFDSSSQEDNNSLLGDLDRRSLYAVSSNEGGLFTQDEQQAATYALRQQQSLATGFYSGPPDQEKNFVDPFADDLMGRIKAGITFLDSASSEEKSSSYWKNQRAQFETSLEAELAPPAADDKKTNNRHYILAELLAQWSSNTSPTDDADDKANAIKNAAHLNPSKPAPEKPEMADPSTSEPDSSADASTPENT